MTLSLTIDKSFFLRDDIRTLNRINDFSASSAIKCYASRFPYDSSHQSHEFLDSDLIAKATEPLPFAGLDLTEDETTHAYFVDYGDDSRECIGKLSEDDVHRLEDFAVRLFGKRKLFPYQEYRLMALHEHHCANVDLFVTCDHRVLLSRHAGPHLKEWGIRTVSPSDALAYILKM